MTTIKQIELAQERAYDAAIEMITSEGNHRHAVNTLLSESLQANDAALEHFSSADVFTLASECLTEHYNETIKAFVRSDEPAAADKMSKVYENDKKFYQRNDGKLRTVNLDGQTVDVPVFFKFSRNAKSNLVTITVSDTELTKRKPAGEPRKKQPPKPNAAPKSGAEFATQAKQSLSEDERVELAARLIRELSPEKKQAVLSALVNEFGFTIRKKPVRKQQAA